MINSEFDGASYTFIPKLSRLSNCLDPVFQYSKSYNQRMLDYKENNGSRDDYIIKLLEEGHSEIIDWWLKTEEILFTKNEKNINHIAKEHYGITKVLSFPTLCNDMGITCVSVISFKQTYANKAIDEEILEYLRKCSVQYHDHALVHQDSRYNFILTILKTLTPNKVVLNNYLISGKPMNCISKHEDISRTMQKYS